ncbi:hypothetical protein GCM10020258_14430 [Sphingomonas yabuuchiae]
MNRMIRPINESVAVAPQIRPEDVAAIKAAGYAAIVNNRPDGEEPGQPTGDRFAPRPRITDWPIPPSP